MCITFCYIAVCVIVDIDIDSRISVLGEGGGGVAGMATGQGCLELFANHNEMFLTLIM